MFPEHHALTHPYQPASLQFETACTCSLTISMTNTSLPLVVRWLPENVA